MESKYINLDQACEYLDMVKSTIYKKASDGTIPCYKPSKKLLFIKEELDEWVKNSRVTSKEALELTADKIIAKNKLARLAK